MIRIKAEDVNLTTDTYTIYARKLSVILTVKARTVVPLFFESAKNNNQLTEAILDEYSFLPKHSDISGKCKLLDLEASLDETISVYREIAKNDKYFYKLKNEKLIVPKDKWLNDQFRNLTLKYGENDRLPPKSEFKLLVKKAKKQ